MLADTDAVCRLEAALDEQDIGPIIETIEQRWPVVIPSDPDLLQPVRPNNGPYRSEFVAPIPTALR